MKRERLEVGDRLNFTGKDYNLAKIFNYENLFKGKELIIESIQRCPCEENKNDKISTFTALLWDKSGFYL